MDLKKQLAHASTIEAEKKQLQVQFEEQQSQIEREKEEKVMLQTEIKNILEAVKNDQASQKAIEKTKQ